MTTSSANNSVFRDSHVASEILTTHTAWIKGLKEIAGLMLMAMEPEIQRNLKNLHAHEMILELKTLAFGEPVTLGLDLYEQTLPKNNTPALHAIRSGIVQKLNKYKKPQPQMPARGQSHGKGKNKLAYAPKPNISLPPKREDPAKDSICHECDGFINRFVNNTIQVSRNNMVYFSAIPRDGIFEIDFSNSYTNESSIYDVSNKRDKLDLDSTLSWHCRLVHISKKRIQKLQHDGLLNSTDLRAFEKCVPYMSGKMARKPYTHQVERAKDLLGLIHTNVCDPFKIISRQGASYFITFTDEFSRYGYVYLLKHKHEVFETFKVFQKEVENQLGKTIKLLRSDRGGESTRTRHAPDCMCLYINAEEHELGDLCEPANYKVALLDSESKKWLNVMNVEMQSIKDNEVWVLVKLPPNGKTVGIDYEETFSSVSDIRSIRILIATAAYYDYEEFGKWMSKLTSLMDTSIKRVSCYTDVGYLTDADDLKSQTGYVFVLNGVVVDWKSAKQTVFATSSAKAEYIAAFDASKEAAWVRKFISRLGVVPTLKEPISMYCDNT
nr:hypothetical protein [Tanacetum cinerariifolium]